MVADAKQIASNTTIDDYTALKLGEMLLKMKERFIDTPEGQKKYAEWHLSEYGCLPEKHT